MSLEPPVDPVDIDTIASLDPHTARLVQDSLRQRCIVTRTIDTQAVKTVAGADASYSADTAYAVAVVTSFPDVRFIEVACSARPIRFPYIPGLLSFRESPAVVESIKKLSLSPDVLIVNGHGYAHPRRTGLACHIGVVLDIPTIGVAANLLTGTATEPDRARGACEPVLGGGEVIGMALRTKRDSKPVYVSTGHKVDLSQAVEIVLMTATTHRFPEPLHFADQISRACRKSGNVPGP
jgi:deoxyribonuclease V